MITKVIGIKDYKNVEAISSKSYVHRLLIAAALAKKPSVVKSNIISEDMKATMNCLNALGAEVEIVPEGFRVIKGVDFVEKASLDCNESGSTARFMLPLAIYFAKEMEMVGHGKLPSRPLEALTTVLREHGAKISGDFLPLTASGELTAGLYEIPGNISSQYITGLLFTLPLLDGDSEIRLTTALESKGYIDITLEVLKLYGIDIQFDGKSFFIKGNSTYEGPDEIQAEGDWSNAAYVLGLAAIKGEMTMTGLNAKSVQGDRAFIDALVKFGADVTITDEFVKVVHKPLKGIDYDAKQIPDLVPALAMIAANADSDSIFRNVERLRIKESDRIEAVINMLKSFGVESYAVQEGTAEHLVVKAGVKSDSDAIVVDGYNDHRIVMAAAFGFAGATKPVIIEGSQAVNKSYPNYFDFYETVNIKGDAISNYGLIGEKLGHSYSKILHHEFGNDDYELIEVSKGAIDEYFKKHEFKAVNVTVPYKQIAFKYCDADVTAKEIGAVNTLVVGEDGSVKGYNTDYLGFQYMIDRAGISLEGKDVVILGNGGTSKTARFVCRRNHAASVTVLSREGSGTGKCEEIVEEGIVTDTKQYICSYAEVESYENAQVIINTTPKGMFPKVDECPIDIDLFKQLEGVVDVIYNPRYTVLIKKAMDKGIKCTSGLPMLIAQGWYADKLFFGKEFIESNNIPEVERVLEKMWSEQ